ncbi:MAG: hypothetical protein EBS91_00115 [Betaproteobacteria bacterium]|nr:hypothetical protein [Betaproteobacteria bacterium]NCA23040.1 hypothetical protein [Betaproteobacteria bacterium]
MTKTELLQQVERLEWALRQIRTQCAKMEVYMENLATPYDYKTHPVEQSPYYILGAVGNVAEYIDGLAQRAIEEVEALV